MRIHIQELPYWIEPPEAFRVIPGTRRFFLDSSLHMGRLGRWSFAGAEPFLFLTTSGTNVLIEAGDHVSDSRGDPFEALRGLLSGYTLEPRAEPPFACGAVGYFSYDLGRMIERIPSTAACDLPIPDIQLGFYDCSLAFDHFRRRVFVSYLGSGSEKAKEWTARLHTSSGQGNAARAGIAAAQYGDWIGRFSSNFTKAEYLEAIRRVQEYIAAGDIYQANLAQRFSSDFSGDPWRLYNVLRRLNPSPFGCYIDFDDLNLASVSPERLLCLDSDSRQVETRPIKGTRPRGKNEEEDELLRLELEASEKDRAENVMIVDMERNDLGRVCEYGSVHVPELWAIEAHPNVYQMVSTVRGILRRESDPVDLLRATFPGGSITGAPKVRAMEIIEEIEGLRRGIYTGSIGYIDFSGNMDLNIVIRSIVLNQQRAYFHGGGGILAYSDPEAEYEETLQKISVLASAVLAVKDVGDDD